MNAAETRTAILVVTSTYPRRKNDTLPRFVHDLSRRLADDFEVHVLTPSTPGAMAHEQMDGVEVHRFRYCFRSLETLANVDGLLPALKAKPWRALLLPFFVIAEIWSIGKLARRHDIRLIHAHWILPQGLALWCARRIWRLLAPTVLTCHGADLFALNGLLFRSVKRVILKDITTVTVVSEAARAKAIELGAEAARLLIRPMGVDLSDLFIPDASVRRDLYSVLFVGRLSEKKGADVLIHALAATKKKLPAVQAMIVGYGPYKNALEALVDKLDLTDSIKFLGALEQAALPDLYRRASCLVMPSVIARGGDQEGLGLVMIEALSCGCPVIASGLDAVRDVIEDGYSGLLFAPGDSANLADKIVRVLNDRDGAAAMAKNGRAVVQSRYGWIRTAGDYRKLFHVLLEENR